MSKTPTKRPTKSAPLNVRTTPAQRELIDRYAAAREMSPSEFVRYCVRVYTDTTPEDGEVEA